MGGFDEGHGGVGGQSVAGDGVDGGLGLPRNEMPGRLWADRGPRRWSVGGSPTPRGLAGWLTEADCPFDVAWRLFEGVRCHGPAGA